MVAKQMKTKEEEEEGRFRERVVSSLKYIVLIYVRNLQPLRYVRAFVYSNELKLYNFLGQ